MIEDFEDLCDPVSFNKTLKWNYEDLYRAYLNTTVNSVEELVSIYKKTKDQLNRLEKGIKKDSANMIAYKERAKGVANYIIKVMELDIIKSEFKPKDTMKIIKEKYKDLVKELYD